MPCTQRHIATCTQKNLTYDSDRPINWVYTKRNEDRTVGLGWITLGIHMLLGGN